MNWYPHVTVAAVIENDGKFLVVKEQADNLIVYNQPAGHLEKDESLVEAVIREVMEETAWQFIPEYVVGVYRMHINAKDTSYLRICFAGSVGNHFPHNSLDDEIIEATWMSKEELVRSNTLRSPLVLQCISDYLQGQRYELDILKDIGNV